METTAYQPLVLVETSELPREECLLTGGEGLRERCRRGPLDLPLYDGP